MQVQIYKTDETINIVPLEGRFQGRTVGLADAVALSDARKVEHGVIGTLDSTWGLTLLSDALDAKTIKGVVGARPFNYKGMRETDDFDTARRLILSRDEMILIVGD